MDIVIAIDALIVHVYSQSERLLEVWGSGIGFVNPNEMSMAMSDYRDLIRVAMFESVQNDTFDISPHKDLIEQALDEYSTRLPEFKLKEKINLELVVPIQLPPDGKRGDCKAVVEAVRDEFIELSGGVENGGATLFLATGSWVSALHGVEVDRCLIVYTAMPIHSWFEAIPKLRQIGRAHV